VLLVYLLKIKNFFSSVVFTKSEVIYTALLGTILFDKHLLPAQWFAILLSVIGVILASSSGITPLLSKVSLDRGALVGLLFGAISAFTALVVPYATSSIQGGDVVSNALGTLLIVSDHPSVFSLQLRLAL
jgi:drug/metabolite transporter (DMT)-like permease